MQGLVVRELQYPRPSAVQLVLPQFDVHCVITPYDIIHDMFILQSLFVYVLHLFSNVCEPRYRQRFEDHEGLARYLRGNG